MAITFIRPPDNRVYALQKDGLATFSLSFKEDNATSPVPTVNLLKLQETHDGVTSPQQTIVVTLVTTTDANGVRTFQSTNLLPAGKYQVEVKSGTTVVIPLLKFSAGYVFVIGGHSLAINNQEKAVTSERIYIIDSYQAKINEDWKNEALYTGEVYKKATDIWNEKKILPAAERLEYEIGVWAPFAQTLSQRDGVDVAILNTAMGGSSAEMWAYEAISNSFEHSFAGGGTKLYDSGYPYFHFENVLKHTLKETGVTAVLIQHGENDRDKASEVVGSFYKAFIDKARDSANMPYLPFILAKSTWLTDPNIDQTLGAVDKVIAASDYVYLGADTHTIPMVPYRMLNSADDGHFNAAGGIEVARIWAEKLTKQYLLDVNSHTPNTAKITLPTIKITTIPVVKPIVEPSDTVVEPPIVGNKPVVSTKKAVVDTMLAGVIFAVAVIVILALKFLKVIKKIALPMMVIVAFVGVSAYVLIQTLTSKSKE